MIKRLHPICFALILLASVAPQAAGAEPETIESLKQKAQADYQTDAEKLKMQYLIALEKYQKTLAESGDLDAAIAVKKESERATALKAALGIAGGASATAGRADGGGTVTLTAKDARLGNGTHLDNGNGLIKNWSRYGAFAAWKLGNFKAGSYKVTLKFRAGNLGGGVLSIRTSKHTEKFSIAGTGSWAEPRTYNLGKIYLTSPDHLTIAALQGNSRDMIYVESVELEPVK